MRPSRRLLWLRLHRWFALGVGWMLALQGLMGATLVVGRPLQAWSHPELFKAAPAAPGVSGASLESVRQTLVASFGREADFTFRPPRDADDTLWVLVRGAWSGTVYVEPGSGQVLGRLGETDGFVNIVFRTHSSLWLGDTGKALLAGIALVYLLLLVTGLVLWWPRRWPPRLAVTLNGGTLRAFFDLHRTAGALIGLVIAVSVASGAYMAWRPLGDFVTALAGGRSVKPPAVPKGDNSGGPAPTIDALVASAQARFPGAPVGYVQVPSNANRPLRVRFRLPDDPHPNGLTSVWLHPRTGAVLGTTRWDELDVGARAVAVVYPLHTGQLGGPPLEAVVALGGLTLGTLGVTGLWLWWRRRPPAVKGVAVRAG
jgi:uncharacterized iron-regulated membrane protein